MKWAGDSEIALGMAFLGMLAAFAYAIMYVPPLVMNAIRHVFP